MAGDDLSGRFEKLLRVGEGRRVKRIQEQAAYIATLEPEFQKLSDAELREAARPVANSENPEEDLVGILRAAL